MDSLVIWSAIISAGIIVFVIVPISNILHRAGWNGWLGLLLLIPGVNIAMLWMFAYGRWPALPRNRF